MFQDKDTTSISLKFVGPKAFCYLFVDKRLIACYEKKGNVYRYQGCLELFEDVGYWLDGDDMDFIEDRPPFLPKSISLEL